MESGRDVQLISLMMMQSIHIMRACSVYFKGNWVANILEGKGVGTIKFCVGVYIRVWHMNADMGAMTSWPYRVSDR